MRKIVLKSIIMSILMIASVYQIIELWSYNVSDQGDLTTVFDLGNKSSDKEYTEMNLISPNVLSVYFEEGDRGFAVIKKTNLNYENIFNDSIKVIAKVLEEGEYEEVLSTNEILWTDRSLLFSFEFPIISPLIANDLEIDRLVHEGEEPIIGIGLLPASEDSNDILVYIVERDNDVYTYSLSKEEVAEINININRYIETIESSPMPAYISSLNEDLKVFNRNVFLPIALDEGAYETGYYEYLLYQSRIFCNLAYINGDTFDAENMEGFIKGFFVNGDVKWSLQKEDQLKYGDDNVLVAYNLDGLLEYTNVSDPGNEETNINLAYNMAEAFLEKDSLLTQKYYLSTYTVTETDITFHYEYTIDDYPIIFSQELLTKYDMQSPLEITISNETVKNYKRILLEIEESDQNREKYVGDYESVLTFVKNREALKPGEIDNMYLGYYWNNQDFADIGWVIDAKGSRIIANIF